MGRGAVFGLALVSLAGCATLGVRADIDPHVERQLPALRAGLGDAGRQGIALRYAVDGWDGHWVDEVLVTDTRFVEHRRRDDGAEYTFGEDAHGAFLRVGADGPWRAPDAMWAGEARTRHALFTAQFLAPQPGDDAELVGLFRTTWEYAYRPAGGSTITFDIARATGLPRAYDVVDALGRLYTCEHVEWKRFGATSVPSSADCWGSNGMSTWGSSTANLARRQRYELVEAKSVGAGFPLFARVAEWRGVSVASTSIQTYELDGTGRSAIVPAIFGDGDRPSRLVVDTGAFWTFLDRDAAVAAGVVATGETPIYLEPPWLPHGEYDVGVVDHLRVAGADLVGVRVLMLPGLRQVLGGADGLLGANVLAGMVVDFDTPHHALRFVPHGDFAPDRGTFRFAFDRGGHAVTIPGAVLGLSQGSMMLDTGASNISMVVTAPGVGAAYPRRRGTDVHFGLDDGASSPDYWTTIDGARLGPFALPSMLVAARDRDTHGIAGSVALVGMRVLRLFRATFDFRNGEVYLTPGDAYYTLLRAGIEVTDARDGGARVASVAPRSAADDSIVLEGDKIVAIDGTPVANGDDVRRLLSDHRGAHAELRVVRRHREFTVPLALDPRVDDCTGPGDALCPADGLLFAQLYL